MGIKENGKHFLILFACFFLLACGLEDVPFIPPVPQSNVSRVMNNRATVRIPNDFAGSPFTHFAVYYRIYVSDVPLSSTISSTSYPAINPALVSSHNFFHPYIDSTTQVNVDMGRLFNTRGYHLLALQGHSLSGVLSSSAWGTEIVFDFSSGRAPTMIAGGTTYTLWRSNGGGLFDPQPDRLFLNRDDLYRRENITPTINADVVDIPDVPAGVRRYTYAAMYITAVGINVATYSNIYSTPALIHVFLLPD